MSLRPQSHGPDGHARRPLRIGTRLALATLAAAAATLVIGNPARAQLTTGLQNYFDFETGTIENVVAGTSGYTPSITTTGSPQAGFTGSGARPLLVGNALNLIRSENDFFSIANIGSGALTPVGGLNLAGAFTLSAWHYLDPAAGSATANRYYVWEGTADFDLSYGTGGNTSGPDNYTAYVTTVTGRTVSLPRNTWNNIVQVFSNDGTNITGNLYINGQFIGSNTTLLSNMNWAGLRYGNSRAGGGRAWDGTIDEIGIWNTSLTAAQAQEVYIRGLQGTGLTAATTGVGSWSSSTETNSWTAGGNWTGGAAIGATGAGAGSSNAVAIFGDYSLAGGLSIDMSAAAADGALGLGAIVLDSGSGPLRIGNSSATDNGVLRLNGATTGAGANTLLYVAGASDLVIANSPDPLNPGSTTLGVTLGTSNGVISVGTGRTATIESVIGEVTAGSGFTKTGNGTLVLSGANTYTGTTAVAAGTVTITSTAALPGWDTAGRFSVANGATLGVGNAVADGDVTILVGTGNFAAGSLLGFDTAAGDRTITGDLGGQTGLAKFSGNTLTLSASNSYTGPTAVRGGTLALNGQGSIASSSGVTLAAAGTGFDISAADGNRTVVGLSGVAGSTVSLGTNSLTVESAAAGTIAGGIEGTGGLIKAGTAALTLSGSSTYSGGTTIRAGSIVASAGSATLGTGGVTLNDAQTGAANTALTVNADLAYGVPVTVANQGSGTSTITFSGAVTPEAGRTPLTSITLDRAATLDFQTSGVYAFNSPISGTGPLTIAGNNSYKIAGGSWAGYTGPVTIASGAAIDLRNRLGEATNTNQLTVNGTIWVVADEAIGPLAGSGSVTTNAAYGGGTRSITIGAGDGTGTFSGVLSEASAAAPLRITKTGTGTQTLSGANTFTGGSTIAAGTLALSGAGTLGGSTSPVALTGGRLDLGGTSQTTGAVTISDPDATGDTITAGTLASASYAVSNTSGNVSLAASLAGAGSLTKTGAGTLTLGAASTFSGGTAINSGTVAANAASAMGAGVTTIASGATLEIGHVAALDGTTLAPATGSTISFNAGSGQTYAIGGLAGAGNLVATGNTLAIGANNASTTYSGVLTADSLTKQGTGTLALSNTGHALGSVTVAAGTVVATDAAAFGAGSVTLAGGRLQYAGSTAFANGIVLSGAAADNGIDLGLSQVEYLVIGGGGGGAGRDVGGGGGAGGYRSSVIGELSGRNSAAEPTLMLSAGSYAVVVGGGGAGGPDQTGNTQGKQGGNSSFDTIVALGGGGGNAYNSPAAANGGSGGGGAGLTVLTPNSGTANQGFGGGTGTSSGTSYGGAGGGGAGAAGANATSTRAGGSGIASSITGTSIFRAGGGGGAGHRTSGNTSLGPGGQGGGGAATVNGGTTSAGGANTGGGGGASRAAGAGGGSGGSGVVIVRYAGPQAAVGGTIDTTSVPGYTIHSFTNVGPDSFLVAPSRTVSGDISGAGGFTFNTPSSTLTLSGNNSYQGGTIVSAGTVTVGSATALGTGPLAVNAAGTVAFDTPGVSNHALPVISGAGTLSAAGKTLTIGADNSSSSFAGSIVAASLTKQGTGTLTLSGASTLADTRIEAGSVFAKSGTAFGAGTVTLAGGGLRVAPGTAISNAIILDGGAASNVLGSAVELDYLVVGGGGGGGGRDASGGGGAGGVLSSLVSAGLAPVLGQIGDTFAVTVGGGGAGGGVSSSGGAVGQGTNGNPSSFATVTALGGGGGGAYNSGGKDGASGGGGGRGGNGGTGTAGEGFAGGSGIGTTNNHTGGGGGGAGAVGGTGTLSAAAGSGGVGLAVPIVTAGLAFDLAIGQVSGSDVFFGGGGGGTPHRAATALASGSGGLGGGGAGSVAYNAGSFPTPGAANTGGGGGAARSDQTAQGIGGAGGSGVVVVRYAGDRMFSGGDDVRTEGGFTYHTFKTVGSSSLDYLGGDATVSSTIGGTGGFTWNSAGTLTLSGSNTFQGGTIISAGTLVAANSAALGTGMATVASGARLRLDTGSIIANPIADLGTGSFQGSLDFVGGGLARTSTAGGGTLGTLLAGSSGAATSLNPAIAWLAQTSDTASDIMRLTNTSGTAQVLSLTYDPLLAPAAPQEAYLGWFDTVTSDWVNAIDGNTAGTGSFFNGSWTAYLAANPTATPSTAIGVYGHDSATNSVWAVVNHNSDFAVIVVPEPGTLALAALGLAGLAALLRHQLNG